TAQNDTLRDDGNKIFNITRNGQVKYGLVGCIGFNRYCFGERSSTVSRCIDFNDNLSLAAGRDLSRV
ncbi:MAG: hypothetical protein OEL58_09115, partial [Desulfobacteraceae bacterium]|nr:hypothetical protein [Desulfobacteraceae bacterium]